MFYRNTYSKDIIDDDKSKADNAGQIRNIYSQNKN